jgi:hypothetical protein
MDKKPAFGSAAAADILGDGKRSDDDENELPEDPNSMPDTKVISCVRTSHFVFLTVSLWIGAAGVDKRRAAARARTPRRVV